MSYNEHILPVRDRAIQILQIGWCQGALAAYPDEQGELEAYMGSDWETPTPEQGACQWCLVGAVMAAMREQGVSMGVGQRQLWLNFEHHWCKANWGDDEDPSTMNLVGWNDQEGRTVDEVIASLQRMQAP